MSSSAFKRRDQLRALYGFDFPDDLFRFWEFVNRLQPLDPLHALLDPLDIVLVGAFEVLSGRFDRRKPRLSPLLHWRYHLDPPEFFTVLAGGEDRLHWGLYLDDPGKAHGCVAFYYAASDFELHASGDDLFQALRLELEGDYLGIQERLSEDAEHAADYQTQLGRLDALRRKVRAYATADRPEHGDAYYEKYLGEAERNAAVIADTEEGMGLVAPLETYRPFSLPDHKLRAQIHKLNDPIAIVEEARLALRDGFPATALKLGKELWGLGGRKDEYAYELLDAAYAALGREVLRQVLRTHREHRDLPSVDIFDAERETGNGEA